MIQFYRSSRVRAAALTAASVLVIATSAHAESPFNRLGGSWAGSGAATFEGGQNERLRCNGYYRNQGAEKLSFALRCASPSTKFEVRGDLAYAGGQVSGSWEERTYNAHGSAAGSGSASEVNLSFSGSASGSMHVNVSGSSQTVAISYQGIALKSVSMKLSRR